MFRPASLTAARLSRAIYATVFFVAFMAAFALVSVYGYTFALALQRLLFGA